MFRVREGRGEGGRYVEGWVLTSSGDVLWRVFKNRCGMAWHASDY